MNRRRRPGATLKNIAIVLLGVSLCELVSIVYILFAFRDYPDDARWTGVQAAATLSFILAAPLFFFINIKLRLLRHKNKLLAVLASTDGMTHLLNRRSFAQRFDEAVSRRPGSKDTAGALLVIDIDHFKQINDQHGHIAGDDVLVDVAERMRRTLDEACLIGRLGGEEFGVLFVDVDMRAAFLRAEALREAIAAMARPGGIDCAVTISIGLAVFDHPVAFPKAYAEADRLLYAAKAAGRNRTHFTLLSRSWDYDARPASCEPAAA